MTQTNALPWEPQIGKPRKGNGHRLVRLKESHHHVAKLFARGLTAVRVAELSGYTSVTCNSLMADPLFLELVVAYRNDPATQAVVFSAVDTLMHQSAVLALKAQRHLLDRFEDAEAAGETVPVREALPVFTDMADRAGVSRKTTHVNINADFAKMLEAAIKRTDQFLGTGIEEVSPAFIPVGPGVEVELSPAPPAPGFSEDLFAESAE